MKTYSAAHLIKTGDLNHHGTLYAGRSAEWMVEASFFAAAAEHGDPDEIVCVQISGLTYKKPVPKGDIITIEARVVRVLRTSIMVYAEAISQVSHASLLESFMTFVTIDAHTRQKKRHAIVLDEPKTAKEIDLRNRAAAL